MPLCHHSAPCREISRRRSCSTAVPGCLLGLPDWTAVTPRPLPGGGGVKPVMSPPKGGRPENFLPQGARCWERTGVLSGDTGTAGVSWDVLGGRDAWALAPGGRQRGSEAGEGEQAAGGARGEPLASYRRRGSFSPGQTIPGNPCSPSQSRGEMAGGGFSICRRWPRRLQELPFSSVFISWAAVTLTFPFGLAGFLRTHSSPLPHVPPSPSPLHQVPGGGSRDRGPSGGNPRCLPGRGGRAGHGLQGAAPSTC